MVDTKTSIDGILVTALIPRKKAPLATPPSGYIFVSVERGTTISRLLDFSRKLSVILVLKLGKKIIV